MSFAMLLRYSFDLGAEADRLEAAIAAVLEQGCRTGDIAQEGDVKVSTSGMGDAVLEELDRSLAWIFRIQRCSEVHGSNRCRELDH